MALTAESVDSLLVFGDRSLRSFLRCAAFLLGGTLKQSELIECVRVFVEVKRLLIATLLFAILFSLFACNDNSPTDTSSILRNRVKSLQDSINRHDLASFSKFVNRSETVGLYKVLSLLDSLYEDPNSQRTPLVLTPIEFNSADVEGNITKIVVKVSIAYDGKMMYLKDLGSDLGPRLSPLVEMGLPSELELTFEQVGTNFLLNDYSFPLIYDLILKSLTSLL